ncbi:hypothetical protein KI387_022398, partial [Taxus chinensis]
NKTETEQQTESTENKELRNNAGFMLPVTFYLSAVKSASTGYNRRRLIRSASTWTDRRRLDKIS